MADQDIPIFDPDVLNAQIIEPDGPQGKPRPAPPRPKPKPKKNPRQPIKPIKVTKEMFDATMLQLNTDRLIREAAEDKTAYGYKRPTKMQQMIDEAPPIVITGRRPPKPLPRRTKGPLISDLPEIDPVTGKPLAPPPLEQPGALEHTFNKAVRMVNVFPKLAESAGEAVDTVIYGLGRLEGGTPEEVTQRQTRLTPYIKKATTPVQEFVKGFAPQDPAQEGTVLDTTTGALASAGEFLLAGWVGKGIGIPSKVATGFAGAGLNINEALAEADQLKASPDQRAALTVLSGLTGLTEMAGIGKAVERFGLGMIFKQRVREVLEEGGQEALQTWLNNVNMVVTGVDPNRPLSRDVLMSALLGGFVGGVFQGGSYAKQKLFAPNPQKDLPPIKKSVADRAARIPPPPGYVPPAPVGRAIPSGDRVVPLADMGLMAEGGDNWNWRYKVRERYTKELEALQAQNEGLRLKREELTNEYYGSAFNDRERQYAINEEINDLHYQSEELRNQIGEAWKKIDDVQYWKEPHAASGPYGPVQVTSPEEREANIDYFIGNSQAVHNDGTPIVGYAPSGSRIDFQQMIPSELQGQFNLGYGEGYIMYQDPEYAGDEAAYTSPIVHDLKQHPKYPTYYKNMVQNELDIGTSEKDAAIMAEEDAWAKVDRTTDSTLYPSANLLPFYMDIRNPLDTRNMYGADIIPKVRQGLLTYLRSGQDRIKTKEPEFVAEEFLRIMEDEIRDEQEPGITGDELFKAVVETLKPYGPYATYKPLNEAKQVLQAAGFDGIVTLANEGKVKEFRTLEEAQEYAEKVGGKLNPMGGIANFHTEYTASGNPFVVEAFTQGPSVSGSRAWIAWKPEQIKSVTGNTGEYDASRPEVYRAEAAPGTAMAPIVEPQTFEVMPPLGGATDNAPFMMLPRWAMRAIGHDTARGVNVDLVKLGTTLKQIRKAAPSQEAADEATQALFELAEQSIDQGLDSLSLVAQDLSDQEIRETASHETFHGAMRAGLLPKKNWVMNHPLLRKILHRPIVIETSDGKKITLPSVRELFFSKLKESDAIVALALEIGPYTIEGKVGTLGLSPAEGIDFLFDIYNHLRTEYGQEGIAKLRSLTRLRPAMLEALDLAESMWDTHAMEIAMPMDDEFQWDDDVVASLPDDYRAEGSFRQRVKNWFSTRAGREVLEENPPEPNIPDEVPEDITPPPQGPPPPGRGPGGGAEGPLGPLFKNHVAPEYNQLLVRTFTRMLEEGGIQADPTAGPPFHQVVAALRNGQLTNVDIDAILEDEGIVWDEFTRLMEETASDAGKVLQSYSEIAKFWNEIIDEYEIQEGIEKPRGGKAGPRLPGTDYTALLRIVPIQFRVRRALKGVRGTALGKNFWQRAGNRTQKAMLTQLSTFAVNSMTSTGQLPIRVATQGIGGWMYQMIEEKGSFRQRLARGNQEMLDSMGAGLEVLFSMNPWQLAQWAKYGAGRTRFIQHQQTIHQLEKIFPDIKKKLFALSSGTETLKTGKRQLSLAKALIPQVKDQTIREQLLKDIKIYENRLEANTKGIGKIMNGVELVYDFHLWPMQWAEYFLRRPMFVAQLTLELKREGKDLQFLLTNNMLDQISPETMERAVNKALEFTYAYMPGTKTGTNYKLEQHVEKAAMSMIEWLNKWGGPLNAFIGEPFAKAAFNGAKFVYEYSPVGGILPFGRVANNLRLRPTVADLNSQIRMGTLPRNTKVDMRATIQDPVTAKVSLINPTNREDYERLAKAMVGTMMYATVAFLRYAIGGPEWWQLDLGEEDEKGGKVYTDIRRLKPISTLFQLWDLVERVSTGNLGDMDVLKVLTEVMTGIRIYDNQMGGSIMESTADWFRNEPSKTAGLKMDEDIGKALAVYITPFLNIRDCLAQFVEEENVKKDTRGEGIMGPIMDRIPFLRQRLPDLTSPTQPGPIKLSLNPGLAQLTGYKEAPGENYAGEEWARMGLYNKTFLEKLPDPKSNRAQNEFFQEVIGAIGEELKNDPEYQAMDDLGKGALWERLAEGVAAKARKIGKAANPVEAVKEKVREKVPGRLRRKQMGLEEELENIK